MQQMSTRDVVSAGQERSQEALRRLGFLLRRHREQRRLTQEGLAERAGLGISVYTVSNLERGHSRPRRVTLDALLDALELEDGEREEVVTLWQEAGGRRGEVVRVVRPEQRGADQKVRSSLPLPPTPFIGREREKGQLLSLLEEGRLVTLTGPGGVGKTRLALEVARAGRARFADGVCFVPLASLTDAGLVLPALAQAVGVREVGGQGLEEAVAVYLQGKELLLVLDNFEHVTDAAPLIGELLSCCGGVRMLVTSRAIMRLAAEQVYVVPPLSMPDASRPPDVASLSEFDAVRLFGQRARAAQAEFGLNEGNAEAVVEICRRLEGLPLAIELAAARVRVFAPPALLGRLSRRLGLLTGGARDLPARQQTLRGAIQWSYSLLDEGEKRLFTRLAVFAGGCTLEAAEAVCNADGDLDLDVVDGVGSLLDQSLLHPVAGRSGEPRVAMLETIREYALERLEDNEVGGLRRGHAAYYLNLAEAVDSERGEQDDSVWLGRLEQEHDNLRAALDWSLEQGDAGATALRLAAALAWFWKERAHWSEGRRWLGRVLALPETQSVARARARALVGLAEIVLCRGDYGAARDFAERSVALWRKLEDYSGLARALMVLACVATEQGDLARAHELYEESVTLWQELKNAHQMGVALWELGVVELRQGDREGAAARFEAALGQVRETGDATDLTRLLGSLGDVIWAQGDAATARRVLEEGVATARTIEDRWALGEGLHYLAWYLGRQGEYDQALALFAESLELAREQGRQEGWSAMSWTLDHMGDVARAQGDTARAAVLYEESLAMFREQAHTQGMAAVLHNQGHLALVHGESERARALFAESLSLFQAMRYTWSVADCLAGLGGVAAQEEQPKRAALLFGAAEAIHEALDASGTLIEPANRAAWERGIDLGRRQLDESAWEEAWEAGRALSLDEAIAVGVRREQASLMCQASIHCNAIVTPIR